MIRELLLTHEEMAKKYRELGKDYEYPYFYSTSKGSQRMFFLGSHHSFEPKDNLFKRIVRIWKKFLEETRGTESVVFIEGGTRAIEGLSRDRIIEKHGEPGFVTYLAHSEKLPVASPEPDKIDEVEELLKHFSRDEVEYYYFARSILQWNKLKVKPDFEKYIRGYLDRDSKKFGWKDYNFSVKHMVELHNKQNSHEFDPIGCERCMYNSSNPSSSSVSSLSSVIRDEKLVIEAKKIWDTNKSLFISYGSGHAIVCEPALKRLLT